MFMFYPDTDKNKNLVYSVPHASGHRQDTSNYTQAIISPKNGHDLWLVYEVTNDSVFVKETRNVMTLVHPLTSGPMTMVSDLTLPLQAKKFTKPIVVINWEAK